MTTLNDYRMESNVTELQEISTMLYNPLFLMASVIGALGGFGSFLYSYTHIAFNERGENFFLRSVAELFKSIILGIAISIIFIFIPHDIVQEKLGSEALMGLFGLGLIGSFFSSTLLEVVFKWLDKYKKGINDAS